LTFVVLVIDQCGMLFGHREDLATIFPYTTPPARLGGSASESWISTLPPSMIDRMNLPNPCHFPSGR
jgi:hypothetical protein